MSTSPGALPVSTSCERCQAFLLAPERSRIRSTSRRDGPFPVLPGLRQRVPDRSTTVAEPVFTEAELAQEFLLNLMVA